MMDAVLINPKPRGVGLNEATVELPLGLAYIAAVLEQKGFQCSIIDANVLNLSDDDVLSRMPADAKLVGLYLYSFNYSTVRGLVKRIRNEREDSVILIGGPSPSAMSPSTLLSDIKADGLIRGEGEYSMLKIMENVRNNRPPFEGEIPGLAYLDTDKGLLTNSVQRITDLDELPFPAFHLLPPFKTYKTPSRKSPVAAIVTSRGCAHNCSFCSKDIFQRKVTFRSAENVLEEIDLLVNKYGVRQIDILDDNFAQKRSRFIDILDGLIEKDYKLALNFQSGIRTENIDDEVLIKMKKAGVYRLAFGIESADEKVLRIHNKKLDLKRAAEVIRSAKEMGFTVTGFFIIGLPGETEEGFMKTLAFAKEMDLDAANFMMAIPFVNTELFRMIENNGRFLIDTSKNIDVGFYAAKVFFEYGDMKEQDVLRRYETAYKEFYSMGKKLKMLLSIRSLGELMWYVNASYSVVKNILRKKFRMSA
jgi:anaerobic magnesium-protoporphyrin IX monomethyl ester cyclase